MENFFETVAEHRGGYILRPDLLDLGVTDRQIKDAIRANVLVRIRPGTYAPRGHLDLTREERHRLLSFAVQDKLPSGVVLSHHSAAVIHTGVSQGLDLSTVHVTRLGRMTARAEAKVVHHGGTLPEEDITEVDGHLVVVPGRAALETGAVAGTEAGLVQTSFVLRHGVTPEELHERLGRMARWPGVAKVRLSVVWAAPQCESVGEVRSIYMFRMGGLPMPRMQVEFFDATGTSLGRVDFEWEDFFHCGEFDGLQKYGRLNPYGGGNLGQVIVDEKRREDRIRDLGRGMSRWVWSDLYSPSATCQRIRTSLEQSRRLHARPTATIIV
ncbi:MULTISPECIES: type IV toxin-antitoxin system AbiEi family antitoxin domain-containing protein [Aeromicrobium]|uniref:type IV toxin-antitoxin system AbiEi family antitoxin domain-containing protein n=1 Tax=Aeromicrobium TaxID=2040 RepID=UPI00257D795D|nr:MULTISPECIES: type IV toxin-antitoxin system AbiEi family antitoxin domain-containing protein [Aeromicrobium]